MPRIVQAAYKIPETFIPQFLYPSGILANCLRAYRHHNRRVRVGGQQFFGHGLQFVIAAPSVLMPSESHGPFSFPSWDSAINMRFFWNSPKIHGLKSVPFVVILKWNLVFQGVFHVPAGSSCAVNHILHSRGLPPKNTMPQEDCPFPAARRAAFWQSPAVI